LVKVGGRRERSEYLGIKNGFLKLSNEELAKCFAFPVAEAKVSIRKQLQGCGINSTPVWLVGGFGNSPYLLKKLQEEFKSSIITRPDHNLSKTVANGAVLHFLQHPVKSRISKATYGTFANTDFCRLIPEHQKREELAKYSPFDGRLVIGPKFFCLLGKGKLIREDMALEKGFCKKFATKSAAENFTTDVYSIFGDDPIPRWITDVTSALQKHYTLSADLSGLCTDSTRSTAKGYLVEDYWTLNFEIELTLGKVEIEARLKWEADGETKYGPVSIVYDD